MNRYFNYKILSITFVGLFLLYAVLGFLVLPYVSKNIAVKSLAEVLSRQVNIETIRFNPFTFEGWIKNIAIDDESSGKLASIEKIYFNLSGKSLFSFAPILTQIEITRPQGWLSLDKNNKLNISDLIVSKNEINKTKEDQSLKSPLFGFSIADFKVIDGAFTFTDNKYGLSHTLEKLNVNLPLISTLKKDLKTTLKAELDFILNKTRMDLKVSGQPFNKSKQLTVSFVTELLDLGSISPYLQLPDTLELKSPGHVRFNVNGEYQSKPETDKSKQNQSLAIDGQVELKDMRLVTSSGNPLLDLPHLNIDASSNNIFSKNITIRQLKLDNGELNLERDANGNINIDLFSPPKDVEQTQVQDSPEPQKSNENQRVGQSVNEFNISLPYNVNVEQASVENLKINLKDKVAATEFEKEILDLDFSLTNVELGQGLQGNYGVDVLTGDQERLNVKGSFSAGSGVQINGSLSINDVVPETYRPYYSDFVGSNLTLDKIETNLDFKAGLDNEIFNFLIKNGQLTLENVNLKQENEINPLVQLEQIALSQISLDLAEQHITIGLAQTHNGKATIARNDTGTINLVKELENALKIIPEENTALKSVQTDTKVAEKPWNVSIASASIDNYSIEFSDYMPKEPVNLSLSDISVKAENITTNTEDNGTLTADMIWQQEGSIKLNGEITASKPSAKLNLDINRIDVKSFQPYLTDYLNVLISNGYIETHGQIRVEADKKGSVPKVSYRGKAALSEFTSKNKLDNSKLFECKSFYLAGMDISVNPLQVHIQDVALTDFYHRGILSKDGKFYIQTLLVEQPETGDMKKSPEMLESKAKAEAKQIPDIRIDNITLQGGHINFSDYFTQPNFTANMTEIAGNVSGLSSSGDTPAELRLKGTHGLHSPLDISGQVDVFKDKRFLDLAISFKNIELPEFNAYSAKYLGYEIEKGKLVLDLKYNIDGNNLNSNNHLFFDQLTLGEKVESEDALSLPIELAISLLKNSEGQIDLDVPIKGDLNDPEFSYGDVVITTFTNLILGVVTAPFKFLGNLVGLGSDKDLGHVTFEPGSETLSPENKEKLDQLVSILNDKVSLKLEIRAHYNEQLDQENLRFQKYESLLLSFVSDTNENQIEGINAMDSELRNSLIEEAYEKAEFIKPRDESGKEKKLSVEEKEKLLITNINVDKTALEALALNRGNQILNYMILSDRIDPQRIFMIDAGPVNDEEINNSEIKALFTLK